MTVGWTCAILVLWHTIGMNKHLHVLFVMVFGLLAPLSAAALSVDFETAELTVNASQELRIPILLDNPTRENINTVQATVIVPRESFSIQTYWLEQSIIPLWVEEPTVTETETAYYVSFTGLIPGGTTESGELFTLVVKALDPIERTTVRLLDPQVYRNTRTADGVALSDQYLFVRITPYDAGVVPQQDVIIEDAIPPEDFFPIVGKSQTVFDGDYFVMFQTLDRQTGIDFYDVLESEYFYSTEELAASEGQLYWRQATNPMRLQDQTLQSYIYVRAHDRAGNSRTVIIPPTVFVEKTPLSRILVVGSIPIVLVIGVSVVLWRRRHRAHIENHDHDAGE